MKRYFLFISALLAATLPVAAQQPLYIVNGIETEQIASIPPDDIENVEMLPADEETIARYGPEAAHGVLLVTLHHDRDAVFPEGSFRDYVAARTEWNDRQPAARVVVRYRITPEGRTVADRVLESTDGRLRRRVLKAMEQAPVWQPATCNGLPVESGGVLRIELPEGKTLPHETELILR